jgi:hypothetical protein
VTPPELEPLDPPDVEPEELLEEPLEELEELPEELDELPEELEELPEGLPEELPELLPDVLPDRLPLLPDVLPEELLDDPLDEPGVTETTHWSRSEASAVLVVKYRTWMVPADETNRLTGEGRGSVARVQTQSAANALSATYTHDCVVVSNASNSHRMSLFRGPR